jgi:hypothetical protein
MWCRYGDSNKLQAVNAGLNERHVQEVERVELTEMFDNRGRIYARENQLGGDLLERTYERGSCHDAPKA